MSRAAVPKRDMGMRATNPSISLDIRLQPKQFELLEAVISGVRRPFYGGAKGGGKSYASRKIMIAMTTQTPGTRGLLLRREYRQLYQNHILPMLSEHPEIQQNQWWNKTDGMVYWPNGSTITFAHCEHESDVFNFQGVEYDWIAVEEATNFSEMQWSILGGSCRTAKRGVKPVMWATGNPGGIGHSWCKRLWIDREFKDTERASDYLFIGAKLRDNQALMSADPDYIHTLEGISDPMLRVAYLDGSWDIYPDQFFEGWNKDAIEIEPFQIPPSWLLFGGLDYGESQPTSFGIYAVDHDKNVYRVSEYYRSNHSGTQHARNVRATIDSCGLIPKGGLHTILADPSMWTKRRVNERAVHAPVDEFFAVGLRCVPANNNRENGWMLCRNSIAERRFFVFKGLNPNFSRTVPSMPRSKTNPEDVDTKCEDHAGDDWRYVMAHVYKPHREVVPDAYSQFSGSSVLKSVRALHKPRTRFSPMQRFV